MKPQIGDIKNSKVLTKIIPGGYGSEVYVWSPAPRFARLRYALRVISFSLQSLCILTAFSFLLMLCFVGLLTSIEHQIGPDVLPSVFRIGGAAALLGLSIRTGLSRARANQ